MQEPEPKALYLRVSELARFKQRLTEQIGLTLDSEGAYSDLTTIQRYTLLQRTSPTAGAFAQSVYDLVSIQHRISENEGYIYNHIKPKLGHLLLQDLTPDRLQAFYNDRSLKGRVDGKGGLSAKTMRNMHNMLHEALDQAMKNRMIPENPSNACVLPKQKKTEISILSSLLSCLC